MNELALGTAQFGQRYGVANDSGIVSAATLTGILSRASSAGIDTLDTAIAYGDSEARLGVSGVASWRVVTKLPGLPEGTPDVGDWLRAHVHRSLQRLAIEQLEAVLLHRPSDLLGMHGIEMRAALASLKAEGSARAVGISIYDPGELDAIWPVWQPDLVQAPFNVLDRRLSRSGWLAKLHRQGVRVHVRSVFLQGLLLMPEGRRPAWFEPWRMLFGRWVAWCGESHMSPLEAALGFARAQSGIERLVVGVDSVVQLDEILAAFAVEAPAVPDDLLCDDRNLIEPSRWKWT